MAKRSLPFKEDLEIAASALSQEAYDAEDDGYAFRSQEEAEACKNVASWLSDVAVTAPRKPVTTPMRE